MTVQGDDLVEMKRAREHRELWTRFNSSSVMNHLGRNLMLYGSYLCPDPGCRICAPAPADI